MKEKREPKGTVGAAYIPCYELENVSLFKGQMNSSIEIGAGDT